MSRVVMELDRRDLKSCITQDDGVLFVVKGTTQYVDLKTRREDVQVVVNKVDCKYRVVEVV